MMAKRWRGGEEGAVAIIVALAALLLIGVGALAVDIGNLYSVRRESQRTADLAALAGAQKLPGERQQACIDALSYLDKNKPGFDPNNPTVPNPTGYKIDPATCNDTGTSDGKTVKISADGLTIEVKVPDQQVNLGLAGVFGYSKGYTAAGATVQIRSPGRVLPFALTQCRAYGLVTVKTDSSKASGCPAATGDFGYLDIPRSGLNNALSTNINLGIDHSITQFAPFPNGTPSPSFPPGKDCDAIPNTTKPTGPIEDPSNGNPVEGANCVDVANGNKAGDITDGLIQSKNKACDGRLTRVRPGATTMTYESCTIDNDTFATFLKGVSLAQAQDPLSFPLASGTISQDILKSPNFFVVPVLYTTNHPSNGYYPIWDFRGFYLECFDDGKVAGTCTQTTTGQIIQLQGYAFNLDAIGGVTADEGDTSIYYGSGTTVPVLIK